jgi:hypothetical protein
MPWLKVNDGEWMEPWVVMVGNETFGAYTRLASYCAQYLTDGLVPGEIATMICGGDRTKLERLADAGRVEIRESGFVFLPRYLDHNPTRLEVEAEREKNKARGKKAAAARWGTT